MIAATALKYGLTLVTRDVGDFRNLGLTIFNPWDARSLEPHWPEAREEKSPPAEAEREAPGNDIEN